VSAKTQLSLSVRVDGKSRFVHFPQGGGMFDFVRNILRGREYPLIPIEGYVPKVILDVGANIGAATLFFKAAYPGATIHCYEPVSKAVRFLNRNVRGLSGVHIHPYGLHSRSKTASIHLGAARSSQSSLYVSSQTSTRCERIRLRRAFSEVKSLGDLSSSILKLDTEGSEGSILRDLRPLLHRFDMIYLEYHSEDLRRKGDRLLNRHFVMAWSRAVRVHIGVNVYLSRALLAQHAGLGQYEIKETPRLKAGF